MQIKISSQSDYIVKDCLKNQMLKSNQHLTCSNDFKPDSLPTLTMSSRMCFLTSCGYKNTLYSSKKVDAEQLAVYLAIYSPCFYIASHMCLQILFSWPICTRFRDQVPQQLVRRPKKKFKCFFIPVLFIHFKLKATQVPKCFLLVFSLVLGGSFNNVTFFLKVSTYTVSSLYIVLSNQLN